MNQLPKQLLFLIAPLLALNTSVRAAPAIDPVALHAFGKAYTAAWSSKDPNRVAAFFTETGSLTINDAEPSVGRGQIATAAGALMNAFPNMAVNMRDLEIEGREVVYRWTMTGRNAGPGGTGNYVRIRGHERWTLGNDGLIRASRRSFDEAELKRQLESGFHD